MKGFILLYPPQLYSELTLLCKTGEPTDSAGLTLGGGPMPTRNGRPF